MMQVWFLADTHFYHPHENIVQKRGFDSVEEHNEAIMTRWNELIKPSDIVWHLGDVGLGSARLVLEIVSQLHGHKHLIAGNHDQVWPGHRGAHKHLVAWLRYFESVQAFARRKINGRYVLLSHFPYVGDHTPEDRFREYRLHDEGKWIIHGHVHSAWRVNGRQLNVGLDAWELEPVSLEEVAAQITTSEMMGFRSDGFVMPV